MTPFDVTLQRAGGGGIDARGAPARAGVVLLSDGEGRPVLLATTGDVRAFLRRRLGGGDEGGGPEGPVPRFAEEGVRTGEAGDERVAAGTARPAGPKADLSGIVATADVMLVGSGLEADLAFLSIARERMPGTWAALTEKWRSWFVVLDPDAPTPVWRKTNLGDAGPVDPAVVLGPLATKDTAGRFGEALDDLFDLCRFPKELALAPLGTACAYKEMGKCPAPCDGSEPMGSYRGRVREALATLRLEPEGRGAGIEAAMREAAARQDFEGAALLKSRLERLAQIGRPAMREARPLDGFRFVAVLGSGRAGWARAWLVDAWSCAAVVDVDGTRAREAALQLAGFIRAARVSTRNSDGTDAQGRRFDPVLLGIIGRHLLAPAARRRGGFVRVGLDGSVDGAALVKLIRAAAKTDGADVEEFDRATLG